MGKEKSVEPVIYGNRSLQIDPTEASSTISYVVHKTSSGHKIAEVMLTDCSRVISWGFSVDEGGLRKIDTVIRLMQRFKDNLDFAIKDKGK